MGSTRPTEFSLDCVGQTLLSDAVDVAVGLVSDFDLGLPYRYASKSSSRTQSKVKIQITIQIKIQIKNNGVGQECPTYSNTTGALPGATTDNASGCIVIRAGRRPSSSPSAST